MKTWLDNREKRHFWSLLETWVSVLRCVGREVEDSLLTVLSQRFFTSSHRVSWTRRDSNLETFVTSSSSNGVEGCLYGRMFTLNCGMDTESYPRLNSLFICFSKTHKVLWLWLSWQMTWWEDFTILSRKSRMFFTGKEHLTIWKKMILYLWTMKVQEKNEADGPSSLGPSPNWMFLIGENYNPIRFIRSVSFMTY